MALLHVDSSEMGMDQQYSARLIEATVLAWFNLSLPRLQAP